MHRKATREHWWPSCASIGRYLLDYLRHSLLGGSDGLDRVLVILQFAGEIGIVSSHIEVTMPGQVEKNDALLPGLFGLQRFVEHGTHGVRSLWRGNNAFC